MIWTEHAEGTKDRRSGNVASHYCQRYWARQCFPGRFGSEQLCEPAIWCCSRNGYALLRLGSGSEPFDSKSNSLAIFQKHWFSGAGQSSNWSKLRITGRRIAWSTVINVLHAEISRAGVQPSFIWSPSMRQRLNRAYSRCRYRGADDVQSVRFEENRWTEKMSAFPACCGVRERIWEWQTSLRSKIH